MTENSRWYFWKKLTETQNNPNQPLQELEKQLDEESTEIETLKKNQTELSGDEEHTARVEKWNSKLGK